MISKHKRKNNHLIILKTENNMKQIRLVTETAETQ